MKQQIKKELDSVESHPFFSEPFVYGMNMGIALFLVFLISIQGFDCALENYQVHAYTLFWIDMMWLLAYYELGKRGISKARRFLVSISIAVFIFEVHDNLWVTTTLFNLDELMLTNVGPVFVASKEFYMAKFSRNFIITFASFLFAKKHFSYSWKTLALIGIDLAYWAAMSYLGWIYMFPTFVVTFFMGSLPAIGMLCFKEK